MSYTKAYKDLYSNTGKAIFKNSSNNTVTLQAPTTISSNYTMKFPQTSGATNQILCNGASVAGELTYNDSPPNMCAVWQNPTGFPYNISPESTLSFNNTNRTLTITRVGGSYSYWVNGVKYTKSSDDSIQITDVTGTHYIYYDGATLAETTTFTDDLILTKVLVTFVYWNANTDGKHAVMINDERHGASMSPYTHRNLHNSLGAVLTSGATPADFVIGNGSQNSHVQFSISAATILDEDVKHTINTKLSSSGFLNIIYLQTTGGNTSWYKQTQSGISGTGAFYSSASGARLSYNQLSGGNWSLQTVTSGNYVLGHVFASNDISQQFFAIIGQAQYTTLANAQAGAQTELTSINAVGLPGAEIVWIATVVYQTANTYNNSVRGRIVPATAAGANFIDWRQKKLFSSAGVTSVHSNLAGLENDDHIQYYLVGGRTQNYVNKYIVKGSFSSATTSGGIINITVPAVEKDVLYYTIEGSSLETGADSNYTVEPINTTRALRVTAGPALEQTIVQDSLLNSAWTFTSSGAIQTLNLSIPSSGRARYFRVHLNLYTLRGNQPTVTYTTLNDGAAI